MRLTPLFACCVASFVVGATLEGGESEVHPAVKWEHFFKTLEAENPELAWEKLKLWFKNNGNIQHEKLPWEDFRIFKEALILEQLKSTEDPVEQDSSEQKIEEAWKEFERVKEEVEELPKGDKVDVVLDKFREFYTQVKDGNMEEAPAVEEAPVEGASVEGAEDGGQVEEATEGEEPGSKSETTNDDEGSSKVQDEGGPEQEVDQSGESLDPSGGEDSKTENERPEDGEEGEIENNPEEELGILNNAHPEEDIEAGEKEQKATDEHEMVNVLSKELLAKLEQLEQENIALRTRIEQLESDLSGKIDSLVTEIGAVKRQVEEEATSEGDTGATNTQQVQELINKSLKLYHADEVGMPDYALESSGAVVFTIGETEPYTRDTPWMGVFGISIWRSCKTPRLAIQKDNSPGNCWSFTGDKGTITIQLSAQVFPEYFTLDHIPLELAPNGNASSAPYHFRILGLDYGNAPKGHVLGNYDFTQFPIQTFAVQQNPYEKFFRFIKLEILSNHGNKYYTCLYRFRVHGRPHDTDTYNG